MNGTISADRWAVYFAAKQESERKHGYITAWAKPERHPFWAVVAQMNGEGKA